MSVHSWSSSTGPTVIYQNGPNLNPDQNGPKLPHPTGSRYPRPTTPIYNPAKQRFIPHDFPLYNPLENLSVTMKAQFFYLLTLLFLPIFSSAASPSRPLLGGWQPIKNLKDPHVKEIGEFAVSEYNKRSKANLEFQNVVKGETQVVSGTNYRLVLEAKDERGVTKNYQAIVWEKPWENLKNLTSFTPVKA